MIIEKIDIAKSRKIKINPVNSNRVSTLGHPCERYLVLERLNWQDKLPYNVSLQYIFDLGNEFENIVLKELMESGFNIIEQQKTMGYKYNITGHIDGLIEINGEYFPLEIKSINPYLFATLSDAASILNHRKYHIKGYYSQLNLYLFLNNKTKGVILFKNKSTGEYKEIWIDIDLEHCEFLLKRAESIENHIKNNTLPDFIEWGENCETCPLRHICGNKIKTKGFGIVNNDELEAALLRRNELISLNKEYEKLDKYIKSMIKNKMFIIGNFVIDGKFFERSTYKIPEELKSKYLTKTKYWKSEINYLGD